MRATDFRSRPLLTGASLALAFSLATGTALAQTPDDFYRAEIVILERQVDPAAIEEQMHGKQVEAPLEGIRALWVEDASGSRRSDLKLTNRSELYLNQAAARLENSGNYKVLATAGWYQSFPPNYDGRPMRVAVGDWLTGADQAEIEGHIEIDRQRYLHVDVHLNHWQEGERPALVMDGEQAASGSASEQAAQSSGEDTSAPSSSDAAGSLATVPATMTATPPELVTWIRETRRMRSEEIHFIDSPTVGVLVFFRKVEN